ncbi:hypothetical protein MHYP_G00184170 [Metynnis hypsauchen]
MSLAVFGQHGGTAGVESHILGAPQQAENDPCPLRSLSLIPISAAPSNSSAAVWPVSQVLCGGDGGVEITPAPQKHCAVAGKPRFARSPTHAPQAAPALPPPRLRVAGEVKVRDSDGAIRSEQLLSAWSRSQRGPPACQAFECSHLGDS